VNEQNVIFWDKAPCNPYINRRFGGMHHPMGIPEDGKIDNYRYDNLK
jgi:hypothetical protein